jgi:hypothetical protein
MPAEVTAGFLHECFCLESQFPYHYETIHSIISITDLTDNNSAVIILFACISSFHKSIYSIDIVQGVQAKSV